MELKPTLNIGGRLMDLSRPQVMGILNCTPDSFFAASRKQSEHEIAERANQIVAEGASVIDVGAYSTRPGARAITEDEEMERLRRALAIVRREQPDAALSVDTFRPDVARMCVEEFGPCIINDVSEGNPPSDTPEGQRLTLADATGDTREQAAGKPVPTMFQTVARLRVPYILMSVQATLPAMVQKFAEEVNQLHALGVSDVILDPGFGFGKTMEQNYRLMGQLSQLSIFNLPLLTGVSRKRMVWQLLGSSPEEALNGTTALHAFCLAGGANMLRVHDVRAAAEAVTIFEAMSQP